MLKGRLKIYTDSYEINENNVIPELINALMIHNTNQADEEYLWRYYKGETPIESKTKIYRTEINSILHENRALQIVEFYEGYIFGEPIKYVRRGNDESLNDEIEWLNEMMDNKSKIALDDDLAEKMLVMGVCPRLVLPSQTINEFNTDVFNIYTLDPRFAFNVYYNGLNEEVVMSVSYKKNLQTGIATYSVYTKNMFYIIEEGKILYQAPHIMGKCPMVEYTLSNVRMGIFEPVLTLMDGIDTLQSNRMDDIQQFVNSILTILGGELEEETIKKLKSWGALSLPDGVDAKYLSSSLNQNDIQTLKEDLMDAITDITGMPNRGGGNGGDTGSAILLRDGWEIADAKSKRIEIQFKKSEKQMLDIVCAIAQGVKPKISSDYVEIRFTRRNYENIQTKSQVLISMLECDKIAPELAFNHCGMFSDPLLAYQMSQEYISKQGTKEEIQNVGDQVSEVQ